MIGIRERLSLEPNTAGVHPCSLWPIPPGVARRKPVGAGGTPSVLAKALAEVAIAF
jgi:hypothetical protein